ncbi:MAG TPA: tol-pal system protein YbgF [candidate division Zixibacteria bacterium]|nr:tol-pal system protein YbgF [candidate division Zixibacteria bacterium]
MPQQIELVEREQRRLRADMSSLRSDLESVRASLADTRATLQETQRETRAVRERVEEMQQQVGRQLGRSTREGDQRLKQLEARLAKLDEELKAQAALLKSREEEIKRLQEAVQAGQGGRSDAGAPGAVGDGLAETEAVKQDYDAAWRLMERKDYRAAIARFKEFLKKHPKSKLAANAQYWIGEGYYALREFDQAILEFDAVRRLYPQGDKAPAALLKQGFAFAELGEKVNARLILQEVIEKYPQAPEAARAKQRLKSLES